MTYCQSRINLDVEHGDLSEQSSSPTSSTTVEVYTDIVILSVDGFLDEWLFQNFAIY